jgi:sugar lactone lactonase YvrE
MAYDAAHSHVVLFGGSGDSGSLNDTWTWNGNSWVEQIQPLTPSAGGPFAMAYDAARGQVVLFGGNHTWTQSAAVNMGMANVCSSGATTPSPCSQTQTLAFDVTANTSVGSIKILTQGAAGLDFQAQSADTSETLCGPEMSTSETFCTVDVTFAPTKPGPRSGAVQFLDGGGSVLTTVYLYGTGTGPQPAFLPGTLSTLGGGFSFSYGVAVDGNGNAYVGDSGNDAVKVLPFTCVSASCVTTLGGGFNFPIGVAVDGAGNVYVVDNGNDLVKEIPAGCGSASCVTIRGGGFGGSIGVAVDGSGNVYVADSSNNAVKEMPAGCGDASCVATLGGDFDQPQGVAVDGIGNVYVADSVNSAVKMMPAGCGSASCVATLGGSFDQPQGVAVDGSGNLYVVDLTAGVKRIPAGCSSASCVSRLAGNFGTPQGVAVDASGNVYAISKNLGILTKLDVSDPPTLPAFAATVVGSTSSDSPQTVTLQNVGTSALLFPIPATGTNPSIPDGFTLSNAGTCPQLNSSSGEAGTLAAGASCTLPIGFTPVAGGPASGSLVLTDNAVSGTQSIALSGTGVGLSFSPNTLGGSACGLHYLQTITASGGTAPYTYTLSSGTLPAGITLASGGALSGTPSAAGSFPITVTATDSMGVTGTQNYTLTIQKGSATITLLGLNQGYTGSPVSASATTVPSGLNVTFTYNDSPMPPTAQGTYTVLATVDDTNFAGTAFGMMTIGNAEPTLTWATPGSIPYGTPLSAKQLNATASVAGTFSYSPALGAILSAGAHTLTATFSPADTASYGTPSPATVILNVAQAGSITALSASSSSVLPGQSITFTAQVHSSMTGTPTGSVSFYDGTTLLGTSILNGGTASFSTTTLAADVSHAIGATYTGDTNFSASSSESTVSVTVSSSQSFDLDTTAIPDQAIAPGGAAAFGILVSPLNVVFPGVVTFTVTGLPPGATGSFSPASLPANSGAQTVTLTVQLPAVAKLNLPTPRHSGYAAFALLFLPLFGTRRMRRTARKLGRGTSIALFLLITLGAMVGLSGCGGNGYFGQQQKSYTVTVTATSGSVQRSSNFTLRVQ